ncbi:hypothetical protein Y032_0049g1845 [Ancylostoma ceylanicum]|uniref:Uncharacterized protein n=1 Tax=Ancylostoma ceylanicum TaxID=53326 RepID=A0A016UBB5_9BILA|nr:hypothetical protein Y032_0049g1845 [Ancylostoma ceylanicum]
MSVGSNEEDTRHEISTTRKLQCRGAGPNRVRLPWAMQSGGDRGCLLLEAERSADDVGVFQRSHKDTLLEFTVAVEFNGTAESSQTRQLALVLLLLQFEFLLVEYRNVNHFSDFRVLESHRRGDRCENTSVAVGDGN